MPLAAIQDSTSDSLNSVLESAAVRRMLDSIIRAEHQQIIGEAEEKVPWLGLSIFFFIAAMGVVYMLLYIYPWRVGRFPWALRYHQGNLMEAYRCLGALMIMRDRADAREQIDFVTEHLGRRFPEHAHLVRHLVMTAIRSRISEDSILQWLNRKANEEVKIQVVDFLADLAYYNNHCNKAEYAMMLRVGKGLGLSRSLVESVVAVREKRAQDYRRAREEQRQRTRERIRATQSVSRNSMALKILGLQEGASFDQVKKAYRKLAMKFHPDRFASLGEAQMKMATERFVEIQKAYEVLERLLA